jgi:arabinose-5-phosphate isomerase
MPKINYIKTAKEVINLEIKALEKLKKNIKNSFNLAVEKIANCQSKIILSGVGKSGLIANKIAATMSSVGSPAFCLSASDSSHGDLGSISKKDILILISYSGKSEELKNIIQYANRNKILLIGIMSKKDSLLYKASDIQLLIPQVVEAAGIVPTSSTTSQLALGDALSIAVMRKKKFGKLDFKKIHPAGSLGAQLKTVEDLMVKGSKVPFVNENLKMNKALKILTQKKLGVLIVRNSKNQTKGIITDGQVRRYNQINKDLFNSKVSKIMTKNPISVQKDMLAAKALNIMNNNKITSLCVHNIKKKFKTIGVLHIHNILEGQYFLNVH